MKKLYTALFLLSIIWSTSFLFIKLLLNDIGPEAIVFYRCFFGAVTLLIIMLIKKVKIDFKNLPKMSLIIIISLFNHAIPWLFLSFSETHLQSNEAAILNAFTPIATLLIGYFFFSQRIQRMQGIGLFIGIIGLMIMMNINPSTIFSNNIIYSVLMLFVTFCYGLGSHLTKKYLQKIDVLTISFLTLAISGVFSFIYMCIVGKGTLKPFVNLEVFSGVFGLGVLCSGLAYLLFYYMVKEGSAEFATMVTYIVPVFASVWGFFFLDEPLTYKMVIGLLIVLLGVFITNSKKKSKISNSKANAAS
ncbi:MULTISPECIES: DMT family transporter [unclassified Bacillus (in: firmicutes)]|uniref:DMT family transporter n=1 Tax=unclassified Bacillus (in: firmicutes) TaxID=185979 RepID=UPI000BEF8CAD|nr:MULTISPECIES: DMT family transporter [unclassified Bacillus (in: firmicutes)]PEJ60388.1 EamA family transporter [Bacillus sp. AFS002410]PEL10601.1 EamA family transporter [Bacillus sp. AFS017336]